MFRTDSAAVAVRVISATAATTSGGGIVDNFYAPYINGEKELSEINAEYIANSGMVH